MISLCAAVLIRSTTFSGKFTRVNHLPVLGRVLLLSLKYTTPSLPPLVSDTLIPLTADGAYIFSRGLLIDLACVFSIYVVHFLYIKPVYEYLSIQLHHFMPLQLSDALVCTVKR